MPKTSLKKQKKLKGFTMAELLVIIAIVGILASIALMSLAPNKAKARDAKRITEVNSIRKAVQMYYTDHHKYPAQEGAWCSIEASAGDPHYCTNLINNIASYLSQIPKDPLYGKEDSSGKIYSYQYITINNGLEYKIHAELENQHTELKGKDFYEISSMGGNIAYNPPFCGDGDCNGTENCLICNDCACTLPATCQVDGSCGSGGGYFTFRIETTSNNQEFRFQADNAQLDINWGDGEVGNFTGTGLIGHTYSIAGAYNISLKGTATRISFFEGTPGLLTDILTPVSDGVSGITSANNMFRSTQKFGTSTLTALNFFDETSKNVTDMSSMFYNSQFNQSIGNWNVSNVTNMSSMFGSSTFNQSISNWNVSNVTNMRNMFYNSPFNQPIGSWDVSNVTNMGSMFSYNSQFNQPIGNWDVSKVTSTELMFYNAPFNQPISNWNVSNVTAMSYMFSSSPFNQPIGNWNVSKVTTMRNMFYGSQFNQPIGNWNVSKVTTMFYMFYGSQFNQPISNWDVSNVTSMSYMFFGSPFNQPIGNWNVSNVANMSYMFYGSPFNQPIGNWNVSNVANMGYMFFGGSQFNQPISNWNVSNVTSMNMMFQNSLSRENYDALLNSWNALPSLKSDVYFGVTGLKYCSGKNARTNIINTYNWIIQGDTYDCN